MEVKVLDHQQIEDKMSSKKSSKHKEYKRSQSVSKIMDFMQDFHKDQQSFLNPNKQQNSNLFDENSKENKSDYNDSQTNVTDARYLNLQISIIDSGIGISKEGLENLFINF